MRLAAQTVVVTGAGSGIGLRTTPEVVRRGATGATAGYRILAGRDAPLTDRMYRLSPRRAASLTPPVPRRS